MAKLSYKVSYYVFYVCVALIVIVLALFFGVGYGEVNAAGLTEPAYTDTLIYLMYGLFAVAVIATLVAAIMQFGGALKENPKGALKSLFGLILMVVLLIVTYSMGSAAPVAMGDGPIYDDAVMLRVTDMFLYSTYALLVIAAIGTLLNLTGIFKQR